ncbi:MAG: RnfABCDGE type electron transport complex subunit G [Prevotellaceae bacterium]|jgi:electron transport complex protein RnfG|nr:RnfABCDGE type electron transport complex subunit G [Prevotellaceae bacterium]
MAKLQSSFKNMLLVLTGISLFAAFALASVYTVTKDPIDEAKAAKQQSAIEQVLPAFNSLGEAEIVTIDGVEMNVIKAFDASGNYLGAAVESYSNNGFGGEVRIMVGFDKNGSIINYSVLEQKETPGLGTKMVDWFKPQVEKEKSLIEKIFGFKVASVERNSSIVGKNPGENKISVVQDGGEIDAMTASTISSRAFLEAVQYAYAAYINDPDYKIDTTSGATDSSEETEEESPLEPEMVESAVATSAVATSAVAAPQATMPDPFVTEEDNSNGTHVIEDTINREEVPSPEVEAAVEEQTMPQPVDTATIPQTTETMQDGHSETHVME